MTKTNIVPMIGEVYLVKKSTKENIEELINYF